MCCVMGVVLICHNASANDVNSPANSRLATTTFSEGLAAVYLDESWALIDPGGQITVRCPVDVERIWPFSQGMAVCKVGEHYGYMTAAGRFAIGAQFIRALPFDELGLAIVGRAPDGAEEKAIRFGLIDKTGRYQIAPRFIGLRPFGPGGFAPASAERDADGRQLWGFIDRRGEFVIPARFHAAYLFSGGLAAVRIGELFGYIDYGGNMVIAPQFYEADDFDTGIARVVVSSEDRFRSENGRSVVWIDMKGRTVCGPFVEAEPFSEGLALAWIWAGGEGETKQLCYGYVDAAGQWVVEPRYHFKTSGSGFVAGRATVPVDDGVALIDPSGDVLVPEVNTIDIRNFSEGLAVATLKDKRYLYLDATGDVIIPGPFDEAGDFSNGAAFVRLADEWRLINVRGEVMFSFSAR